jgi:hypothetical protein
LRVSNQDDFALQSTKGRPLQSLLMGPVFIALSLRFFSSFLELLPVGLVWIVHVVRRVLEGFCELTCTPGRPARLTQKVLESVPSRNPVVPLLMKQSFPQ